MSTVLTNGIIIPDIGSRNWGGDLANNWNILDVHVGYMTDVKNRVTTLENSVAENSANIQINTSNISALQSSKQDVIEDLETIRAGATAGANVIEEHGDYFIRFSCGLQICWGHFLGITTSPKTISYAKAFSDSASISVNGQSGVYVTVSTWTNSSFTVISTTSSAENAWFLWSAIGRWK